MAFMRHAPNGNGGRRHNNNGGHNNNRPRYNNGGNNNGGNNNNQPRRPQSRLNQVFDSNGADVRVRGTALQIVEKYQSLARDAQSAGDRVLAQSHQQHAEHYQRLHNEILEEHAAIEAERNAWRQQQQEAHVVESAVGDDTGAAEPQEPRSEAAAERADRREQPRRPRPHTPRPESDVAETTADISQELPSFLSIPIRTQALKAPKAPPLADASADGTISPTEAVVVRPRRRVAPAALPEAEEG